MAIDDPTAILEKMSLSLILLVYLPTIIMQWLFFALIFLTVYREKTGMTGIGFKRIRPIDFLWAIAFLLVANLLMAVIALLFSLINIEIPGELGLILPTDSTERIFWVILSLTAAICEETVFRGYLLTRLKIFAGTRGWVLPIILSSLSFGAGHTYQGIGGFVLMSIYGSFFALLYIRTGSIWPAIIAHFFQDFSALFYPYQP
nr:CPBP family intramembrane metalloprotease [candidate division Zixibacteria bacterium]